MSHRRGKNYNLVQQSAYYISPVTHSTRLKSGQTEFLSERQAVKNKCANRKGWEEGLFNCVWTLSSPDSLMKGLKGQTGRKTWVIQQQEAEEVKANRFLNKIFEAKKGSLSHKAGTDPYKSGALLRFRSRVSPGASRTLRWGFQKVIRLWGCCTCHWEYRAECTLRGGSDA